VKNRYALVPEPDWQFETGRAGFHFPQDSSRPGQLAVIDRQVDINIIIRSYHHHP